MSVLSDLVKSAVPGSTTFLLLGLILGLLLLSTERLAQVGRRWLGLLVLVYLALATPLVSAWLQGGIRPVYPRVLRASDAQGARVVVVLGNGIVTYTDGQHVVASPTRRTAFNVLEGARLYALLGGPTLVVSGGIVDPGVQLRSEADLMAEYLTRMGVPSDRLRLDAESKNTFEQSMRIAAMLGTGTRVVLVTTPIHMARALALFESRGLKPIPSPAPIEYAPEPRSSLEWLVPNPSSLRASELVMYEYLASVNGWARGWFAPVDAPQ